MKKPVALLLLVIFLPARVRDSKVVGPSNPGAQTKGVTFPASVGAPGSVSAQPSDLSALSGYEGALAARGEKLQDQGILIETMDGHQVLANQNADTPFNPASVMKLATSYAALSKFGPDYRFRTNFFAAGPLENVGGRPDRKLDGDLVVEGDNDPMFSAADAEEVAHQLAGLGISRVTGNLRIAGQFTYFATGYRENLSPQTSAEKLKTGLARGGVRIDGGITFGDESGTLLLSHYSDQLIRILLFQNAHSSNAIAEVVGQAAGGAVAIQNSLIHNLGLAEQDVFVGRPSGLDFNRITPRAALKVVKGLITLLAKYALTLQDMMPVAGVDSGTLRGRFAADDLKGAIIAKTGTLMSLDGGVSTLVGMANTKRGPLLFAIFDSAGSINQYRRLQDQFLEKVVEEEGGPVPVWRVEDELANYKGGSIIQVTHNRGVPAPERAAD